MFVLHYLIEREFFMSHVLFFSSSVEGFKIQNSCTFVVDTWIDWKDRNYLSFPFPSRLIVSLQSRPGFNTDYKCNYGRTVFCTQVNLSCHFRNFDAGRRMVHKSVVGSRKIFILQFINIFLSASQTQIEHATQALALGLTMLIGREH